MVRRMEYLVAALLALTSVIAPAGVMLSGAPAAAQPQVKAVAGFAGWFVPGRHIPVVVTVESDRLRSGTIEVRAPVDAGSITVSEPVEIAGGSRKKVVVVVPSPRYEDDVTLRVTLLDESGAKVGESQRLRVEADLDVEVVGVLPELAELGVPAKGDETVALAGATEPAKLVAVGAEVLAAGPNAVDALSQMIGTGTDPGALTDSQSSALMLWVQRGGRLVLDAPAGQPVDGLPEEWQPGAAGYAFAGAGEVRLAPDQLAGGSFDGVLEPGADSTDTSAIFGMALMPTQSVTDLLGVDAGFRLPALGSLTGVLVVYVLLVGPVTFAVLRRTDHRVWAWAVIPALAVVVTGLVVVAGTGLRQSVDASHATILRVGPGGGWATTSALVSSRNGGTAGVLLPAGWAPDPVADWSSAQAGFQFGIDAETSSAVTPSVVGTGDGATAEVGLGPGEFALAEASGPVDAGGTLEVTATSTDGDTVTGTVRNTFPFAMEEVAVFVGDVATKVGRIEAGEKADFAVENVRRVDAFANVEPTVWEGFLDPMMDFIEVDEFGRPMGSGGEVGALVSPGLWTYVSQSGGENFLRPGHVVVAGWTDSFDAPLRLLDGDPITKGRTLVTTTQAVAPEGPAQVGSRREVVLGMGAAMGDGMFFDDGGAPSASVVYRLVLPPGATTAEAADGGFVLELPPSIQAAEIFVRGSTDGSSDTSDEWAPIPTGFGRDLLVAVPPAAVRDGVVLVRVDAPDIQRLQMSSDGTDNDWSFRPRTAEDDPVEVVVESPSAEVGG